MSDTESDSIELIRPGLHSPSWQSGSNSSLGSLLISGSNYELVEVEDVGSFSSVNSDDLDQDDQNSLSCDSPRSLTDFNFNQIQVKDHTHQYFNTTFDSIQSDSDNQTASDSLSTLRLSYAFPDPTDTELSPQSSVPSPILSDQHQLSPILCDQSKNDGLQEILPNTSVTQSTEVTIKNQINSLSCPGDTNSKTSSRAHLVSELHVYLFGQPMSRSEEEKLLKALRTNCLGRHGSFEPLLHLILHDFTRLPETLARRRFESLPARPALIVHRIDHSDISKLPNWLLHILIKQREQDDKLMMFMMISAGGPTPDLLFDFNTELKELCLTLTQDQGQSITYLNNISLTPNSITSLQKLIITLPSVPKPSSQSTKATIVSFTLVLALLTLLVSWFTIHSTQLPSSASPFHTSTTQSNSSEIDVGPEVVLSIDSSTPTVELTLPLPEDLADDVKPSEEIPSSLEPSTDHLISIAADQDTPIELIDPFIISTSDIRPTTNQSHLTTFSNYLPINSIKNKNLVSRALQNPITIHRLRSIKSQNLILWVHQLPKRLRKGIFNLQHHPQACLNKFITSDHQPPTTSELFEKFDHLTSSLFFNVQQSNSFSRLTLEKSLRRS
ncbi:hypothetical protein CROQUDRAFT_666731 [Cronartium quercuum f. sp. fusiforme G11]|uniref:Uncharacterized protein n=1 Tax=Cronartium quercuum f. sp. fusiforme G11 TaxID=708437 RepID=A0A9P6N542_9BASI|nr:hypothetical protein CROQUDRAFT_666731 [Cronartium quercuum f. sp. fusiforme G11]